MGFYVRGKERKDIQEYLSGGLGKNFKRRIRTDSAQRRHIYLSDGTSAAGRLEIEHRSPKGVCAGSKTSQRGGIPLENHFPFTAGCCSCIAVGPLQGIANRLRDCGYPAGHRRLVAFCGQVEKKIRSGRIAPERAAVSNGGRFYLCLGVLGGP